MFDAFPKTETVMPEGPAAAARLLEPALAQAAGPDVEPVSLTIDYGVVPAAGATIVIEAALERATRTLAFAHARLLTAEGVVVASGSAVFRRLTEITKAA